MTSYVLTRVSNGTGFITLDRPKALNSLSLDMVRALTEVLMRWKVDPAVRAVVLGSTSEKALCAGGDIRFFYEAGNALPTGGSALLEDFFTEEYALNHLIHFYPKPFVSLMDGVVMGGGMGIAQAGPQARVGVVTERTKMAMPEVNIGLFPDVGGSHFLSRAPGALGNYLGLTGLTVGAADAIYLGLADVFVAGERMPALLEALAALQHAGPAMQAIRELARQHAGDPGPSPLEAARDTIDRHFSQPTVAAIMASLEKDESPFAQKALAAMRQRSPLMMCVTLELLRRGAQLDVAGCLRLERNLVRRNFENGEVLEGVRALVIDKDNAPKWNPPTLGDVTQAMVDRFFEPAWPAWAHPLRHLQD